MRFKNWKAPKMEHGKFTKYNWIPYHPKNIQLGQNVDIGSGCRLFAHEKLIIEDNVEIGGGTYIYTYNSIDNIRGPITIKKNAKIGAHCLIFPNVIIEAEEYIPAKSIVYINKNNERVIKR